MTGQFRLLGVRNALSVWPSFLTPTFARSGGDNHLYVQVIDNLDRIVDFSTADGPEHSTYVEGNMLFDVGDLAVHAFGLSVGEIYTGQRKTLASELHGLVDDPRLSARPLVRLGLVEFTHREDRLDATVHEVMNLLATRSKFSAEHWRDVTLLTRRARAAVAAELRMAGRPLSWFPELEPMLIQSRGRRATLELPQELRDRLFSNDPDLARFRKHMSAYLKAAKLSDELQIVSSKSLPSHTEDSAQKAYKRATRARWLLRGFGKGAVAALRSRELSTRLGIFPLDEASDVLPRLLQADAEEVRREWVYVADLDESSLAAAAKAAQTQTTSHPPHLVCIHEPDLTSVASEIIKDWYGVFADTTLIVRPRLSSTGSTAAPSRARLVRALLDTKAALEDEDVEVSWPAWTLFSLGATKQGVQGAAEAYRLAFVASQNLVLHPDGEDAAAVVTSVGNPFPEAADQIDAIARRISRDRQGLRIAWRKAAFSSFSVPAQVGLLQTAQPSDANDPNVVIARVEDILRATHAKFERLQSPFGALFRVFASEDSFDVAVSEPPGPEYSSRPRIHVVQPERRRRSWDPLVARNAEVVVSELPLVLDSEEPLAAADYLSRLGRHGGALREAFGDPLNKLLNEELLSRPERFSLYDPLQELSRATTIDHVDFEVKKFTRLPGFRLDVRGALTLHVKLDYGDKEDGPMGDSYPGAFIASFEPGSAMLVSATVDTSSFFE